MEPKENYTMDDFLQESQITIEKMKEFADAGKKSVNMLKWLYGIIIVILLALYTDTRIDVTEKADASEVQDITYFLNNSLGNYYLSKEDAYLIYKTECLKRSNSLDSLNINDKLFIESILKPKNLEQWRKN
jgi:anaerobic C4-dicarboxylate transporter